MPKERTPGLTAVSISITIDALARIDARAAQLGLSRSAYMGFMSLQNANQSTAIAPEAVQSPSQDKTAEMAAPTDTQSVPASVAAINWPPALDFTSEVYDFLLTAIPALEEYEESRDRGETNPGDPTVQVSDDVANSRLWRFFLLERGEILRLKWIDSQKAGCDVGFSAAIKTWLHLHRTLWIAGIQSPEPASNAPSAANPDYTAPPASP
jgi:hypothetical protein